MYTGHDTKVMMNSSKGTPKKSKLEKSLNRYIIMGVLIQFFLCLFAAIWSGLWTLMMFRKNSDVRPFYLELDKSYQLSSSGVVQT